jgi:hypothetical protein
MKATTIVFALAAATSFAAEIVTVEAGDYDRLETVVECQLPVGVSGLAAAGQTAQVQHAIGGDKAWFIIRDLKHGESRTFRVIKADGVAGVQAKSEKGMVTLSLQGKTALVYRTEKTEFPPNRPDLKEIFRRGGYIHPVLSPSGKQVTDDYSVNHKHHHGIWWAWTHTEFEGRTPDFWNMGDGKGTVEFVSLDQTWAGPVHAGFISQHRQMDLTEKSADGTPLKPKTALLGNLEREALRHWKSGKTTAFRFRRGGVGHLRAWTGKIAEVPLWRHRRARQLGLERQGQTEFPKQRRHYRSQQGR